MLKFAGLPVHDTWSKPWWETRYMCDLAGASVRNRRRRSCKILPRMIGA